MNKDVIYIAPEDDITDVIAKLKGASQKIVAIVPPQPAGIFRSAVNIKLIVKTAEEAEKVPVLVTSDPAILKLAATAHVPVTENLNTPPSVPTEKDLESRASTPEKEAEIAEDFVKPPRSAEKVINSSDVEDELSKKDKKKSDDEDEDDEDEERKEEKEEDKKDSDSKKSKTKNKFLRKIYDKFPWIEKNRKILFVSIIVLIFVAAFCVWAFVFAPSVKISLNLHASSNNFSETATFTTKQTEEDATNGKFYIQEEKVETESKVNFSATGKKDLGNKASGSVNISIYFDALSASEGSIVIPGNTSFTYGGLKYLATSDTTVNWSSDNCENGSDFNNVKNNGCKASGSVKVSAAEPGENYNLDSGKKDWSTNLSKGAGVKSFAIENNEAISGGTSRVVTVVQQSDIDEARTKFAELNESDGKNQLFNKISDTVLVLKDTYQSEIADPVVTPKVGEEVAEGTTPMISSKATFSVYTIDLAQIEKFIREKATLGSDQKIFSLGSPFVEHFNGSGDTFTGRLKTTYKTGPNITEEDVMNKALGRKIGEIQSLLKSINGVDSVSVEPSFFWVSKVPNDQNKVHISLKIDGKEFNGLEVEDENKSSDNSKSEKTTENQESKEKK